MLPSGSVPLSVNAYYTASPIRSIRYWCEYEGRKVVSDKFLVRQSDLIGMMRFPCFSMEESANNGSS